MRRFESEFALHGVNKTQTTDRDRFQQRWIFENFRRTFVSVNDLN
jgi:hypothetical protein